MLSSYYASSLLFIAVIILVCLSTRKIGFNSLIKQRGNGIITLLAFLSCFSLMGMFVINFFKLKPNYLMRSAWYVLSFFDHAFHSTFINAP